MPVLASALAAMVMGIPSPPDPGCGACSSTTGWASLQVRSRSIEPNGVVVVAATLGWSSHSDEESLAAVQVVVREGNKVLQGALAISGDVIVWRPESELSVGAQLQVSVLADNKWFAELHKGCWGETVHASEVVSVVPEPAALPLAFAYTAVESLNMGEVDRLSYFTCCDDGEAFGPVRPPMCGDGTPFEYDAAKCFRVQHYHEVRVDLGFDPWLESLGAAQREQFSMRRVYLDKGIDDPEPYDYGWRPVSDRAEWTWSGVGPGGVDKCVRYDVLEHRSGSITKGEVICTDVAAYGDLGKQYTNVSQDIVAACETPPDRCRWSDLPEWMDEMCEGWGQGSGAGVDLGWDLGGGCSVTSILGARDALPEFMYMFLPLSLSWLRRPYREVSQ